MKTCYTAAALIVLCGSTIPAWTDDGHAIYGTWKADFTKARQSPPGQLTIHLVGDTCEITSTVGTPPQKYRLGAASENGRPTLRRVDARTLELTRFTNGQPAATTTYTVSDDGQELVQVIRGTGVDGDRTIVSRRVGGAELKGLDGVWQQERSMSSKPVLATFRPVEGGVEFGGYVGYGSTSYILKFDGTVTQIAGGAITMQRPDSKTLLVTRKALNGSFVGSETWTVSEDGRTLSLTSVADRQGVKVTNTMVFDRE